MRDDAVLGRALPLDRGLGPSSQEPTQRRLEENPFVAIDPRPDPEELSHAPTSQVPRIHDSCHTPPALLLTSAKF